MQKLLEKIKRKQQDWTQKASIKCASVCRSDFDNPDVGFFCYHAMKYDVTYPILFFGMKVNITKNRQDHLIFEIITNDSKIF